VPRLVGSPRAQAGAFDVLYRTDLTIAAADGTLDAEEMAAAAGRALGANVLPGIPNVGRELSPSGLSVRLWHDTESVV